MKFLCGSCRTKYQISDDKVRGKVLTIRCKKCGAKVVVKESLAKQSSLVIAPLADEESKASEVVQPKVAAGGSAAALAAGAASGGSLASAFDVAMGGGLDDMPTSVAPTPNNEAFAGVEWYVAVDGAQTGPFAFPELVKRIQSKEILGRHYVWQDGFDNWRRIRDVPDLASHLPAEAAPKKKPPPPPPAPPTDEDSKVVDFAQKRAERDKRAAAAAGPSEDLTAGLVENPTARASAQPAAPEGARSREAQLDSVLDEALGLGSEGKTAKAEANASSPAPTPALSAGALALSAPAGQQPSLSDAAFANERGSDAFLPEDLFDKVPRASEQEMVARESTRFFVAAAGVNSQKKKNRFGTLAAVGAGVAFVAFMGLWAGGVINVSIPGIGNPFQRNSNWVPEPELALELSEDQVADLRKLSEGEREKRVAEIRKKRRKPVVAKNDGYVSDEPAASGSSGPRGDNVGAASIEIGGGVTGPGSAGVGTAALPTSAPVMPLDGTAINEKVISRIVKENVGAVVDCSRRERSTGPLKGKAEFALTVEPDGSVSKVAVQTASFKGTSIAACISDRMKNWRFPTFSGPSQAIVVPFVFTSD